MALEERIMVNPVFMLHLARSVKQLRLVEMEKSLLEWQLIAFAQCPINDNKDNNGR